MGDVFTKKKRSSVMRAIKSGNTSCELLVRKALHRLGYRFTLHGRALPGKPDIVLPRYKVAIQVRGCFWHGHSCKDGHTPKTRRDYWVPKLRSNKLRDKQRDRAIRRLGWALFVVWECKAAQPKQLVKEIRRIVSSPLLRPTAGN